MSTAFWRRAYPFTIGCRRSMQLFLPFVVVSQVQQSQCSWRSACGVAEATRLTHVFFRADSCTVPLFPGQSGPSPTRDDASERSYPNTVPLSTRHPSLDPHERPASRPPAITTFQLAAGEGLDRRSGEVYRRMSTRDMAVGRGDAGGGAVHPCLRPTLPDLALGHHVGQLIVGIGWHTT